MSSSLTKKAKAEVMITIARKLEELIDGVTKSKEVSKEFYLLATDIQNQTEDIQKKIIWTASRFFIEDWIKSGMTGEEKEINKLNHSALSSAFKAVIEEKNE